MIAQRIRKRGEARNLAAAISAGYTPAPMSASERPAFDDDESSRSTAGSDSRSATETPRPESVSSTPGWADALSDLTAAFFVLLGVGCSLALALHSMLHRDGLVALLTQNTMTPEARGKMLLYCAVGGLLLPVASAVYLGFRRSFAAVASIGAFSRIVCPLLLSFAVPQLLTWNAFVKEELLLVISLTGFGLLLERLLRVSLAELECVRQRAMLAPSSSVAVTPSKFSSLRRALQRLRAAGAKVRALTLWRRVPFALTVVAAAATGGYFAYYTVLNHYRLQTSSWDLAIFDNMMWNLLRGEWFKASPDLGRTGSHIQFHATFVAYLLVPFYALRQQADTLLVLQALIVGAASIPLYLLGKLRTGSTWIGLVLAVAYCLHGPLHGPVFYDFHFLTLAPFFVFWVLYFFETGRKKALVVTWLITLLVREDVAACLSVAALFLLVAKQRPAWAFFGGVLSAIYFIGMKFGIMPLHRAASDKQTFTWMFKDLVAAGSVGYDGVVKTIVTNPLYTLNQILDSEKLSYLLRMFGPVLLLPVRSAKTWILLLPAAIFTLLSSGYKPLYQTFFQYTSNWTPYLFFGAAIVIGKLGMGEGGRVRQRAAVWALLVSAVFFSYHHGAILRHDNFRGGFRRVVFDYTEADKAKYAELKSLIALIPKTASVVATETEAPHVSNREDCFTMRFGHLDADYMLLAIAEVRRGDSRKHFQSAVNSGNYGFVERRGEFMLWQRGAPKDKNAEGLRLIGPDPKPKGKR